MTAAKRDQGGFNWRIWQVYREKSRKSLRWRLTGSHLLAVFVVPASILIVAGTIGIIVAVSQSNDLNTSGPSAAGIAFQLEDRSYSLEDEFPAPIERLGSLGRTLSPIVALVTLDGTILESNDASLEGQPATQIHEGAIEMLDAARDEESVSIRLPGNRFVESSPVYSPGGEVVGVVIVDSISDTGTTHRLTVFFQALGITAIAAVAGTVLWSVPALLVASVLGVRRARSVAQPVQELSAAALELAEGNLDRRANVTGEDEVAQLGQSFNLMADRLQESLRSEAASREKVEALLAANRDLVANASHELRTPVAVIRAHLEAMAERPADAKKYTNIALGEADRLERLVNDLFELVRIETGSFPVKREPFAVAAAVNQAVDSLAEPARREAGLVVRANLPEAALTATGDEQRVVQVLQNLIRNAVRFTPEGGIVLVSAHAIPTGVAITVRDTGTGIEPEDLPHVFDRFYRSDQSRSRSSGGAGLGLAIARDMIQAMGGTLTADSTPGEGSVFTLTLPTSDR